jgi:hypothetical protein
MKWLLPPILGILAFFAGAVVGPLLIKDLEAGTPWLAIWVIRRIARRMPDGYQERYEEEWLAELDAVPGVFMFKLCFALRIALRSRAIRREAGGRSLFWEKVLDWFQSTLQTLSNFQLRLNREPRKRHTEAVRPVNRKPSNWLQLMVFVLEEPARTRRLAALIATAGACAAAIVYVIQISPNGWRAVVASTSALALSLLNKWMKR